MHYPESRNLLDSAGVGRVLPWLLLLLGLRLISLWLNNSQLFFDEAQYWFWSREPAFGYFSKPPVLAWLIALTTWFSNEAFFVRLAAPILHTITPFMIFLTSRRLFDDRVAVLAALTFAILPGISLSSMIISTDVPLLLFWSIALYAYVRLWEGPRFLPWGLCLGVAIGLGTLSKYAMLYFVGCAIIHLLIERDAKNPVRSLAFWLACFTAALIILPNVLWNMQNGFVTVSHTGENMGWSVVALNWTGTLEFIGSQFGVFGPILFAMLIATAVRMTRDSVSAEHRMLLCFTLPVIGVIVLQAFISKAYANWAAAAYVAATILVAEVLVNRVPAFWNRISMSIHLVVLAAISLAVCFAAPGQLRLPFGVEPFKRTQGAIEISQTTAAKWREQETDTLLMSSRKLSALMNYYLRDLPVRKTAWRDGFYPRDHYQLVQAFQDQPSVSTLLVTDQPNPAYILEKFDTVEPLAPESIQAGEISRIYYFKLSRYKEVTHQ